MKSCLLVLIFRLVTVVIDLCPSLGARGEPLSTCQQCSGYDFCLHDGNDLRKPGLCIIAVAEGKSRQSLAGCLHSFLFRSLFLHLFHLPLTFTCTGFAATSAASTCSVHARTVRSWRLLGCSLGSLTILRSIHPCLRSDGVIAPSSLP